MDVHSVKPDRHKASDVFYVIHKNNDQFLYISEPFAALWGTLIDDSSSASTVFLRALHSEDRPRMQHVLTNLHGTSVEKFRILRQDGTFYWIQNRVITVPVSALDIYYVGVLEEISAVKNATITRRLNMEKLISYLAARLIQVQPQQFYDTIHATIRQIGEAMQADRSYFFQIDGSAGTMSNVYEWCKRGIDSHIDSLQNLPIQDYPWVMEQFFAGKLVNVTDVQSLPPEAGMERRLLERQDISSVLMFPIFADGKLIGNIGFDTVSQPRVWADEDIVLIKVVAQLIGSAFQRWNDQSKLTAQKIRLSLALEAVGGTLFDVDVETGTVYVSRNLLDNLGISHIYSESPLLLDDVWPYIHPDDVGRLSQLLENALSQGAQTEEVVRLLSASASYHWYRIRGQLLIHPLTQQKRLVGTVENLSRKLQLLLTEREIEVLYLLVKNLTSKGIAQRLGISTHTVNNHIRKIYAKLGVNSRLEAILKANSLGFLHL